MHLVSLVLVLAGSLPAGQGADKLAGQARAILHKHCAQCHGSGKGARADLKVLDHKQLVNGGRPVVVAGKPDDSELLQLVEVGSMPPGAARKVSEEDQKVLRAWVLDGAPDFPPRSNEANILALIQADVNQLPQRDRVNVRYLSLNHLLDDEDAAKDLDVYRAALTKAVNLLSTKAQIVAPRPIDPDNTLFRVRIDELGWDTRPFLPDPKNAAKDVDPTLVTLYDLLLLEYPYAAPPDNSDQAKALVATYLKPAQMLRPVPYVRGDWFAAVATESPLYADLLALPASFKKLEEKLELGTGERSRAGLIASKYIRPNRILERGSSDKAVYWRTFDLNGPKALANLVKVAADDPPKHTGGEAVFSLANGLPGFYVGDGSDRRVFGIPKELLTDEAVPEGLRNGRACLRCHTGGLQPFADVVNKNADSSSDEKVLQKRYPPLDEAVAADNRRFAAALAKVPGQPADREPLTFVAQRPARNPAANAVRPLDGLTLSQSEAADADLDVEVTTLNQATSRSETVFHPGQIIAFRVHNTGKVKIFYELVGTSAEGEKRIFSSDSLEAGGDVSFSTGKPITGLPGKEQMTVYASKEKLPAGLLLKSKDGSVTERVVHPLYKIDEDGKTIRALFDPAGVVKKSVTFETVVP